MLRKAGCESFTMDLRQMTRYKSSKQVRNGQSACNFSNFRISLAFSCRVPSPAGEDIEYAEPLKTKGLEVSGQVLKLLSTYRRQMARMEF